MKLEEKHKEFVVKCYAQFMSMQCLLYQIDVESSYSEA